MEELIADTINMANDNNAENMQKLIVDNTNTQELVTYDTNIQSMYGEYSYGSSSYGSGVQALANITATAISATPSHTPCTVGICTVNVSVTWTNIGGTDGSFVPNITIDGIPADPIYSSEILAGNNTNVTHEFLLSNLSAGDHTICPYPN